MYKLFLFFIWLLTFYTNACQAENSPYNNTFNYSLNIDANNQTSFDKNYEVLFETADDGTTKRICKLYNEHLHLIETIEDDGIGQTFDDLEGVTYRHINQIVTDSLSGNCFWYRKKTVQAFNIDGVKTTEHSQYVDPNLNQYVEESGYLDQECWKTSTTIRTYDSTGRIIAIEKNSEDQSQKTALTYDNQGFLKKIKKPNGTCLDYSYNKEGLLETLQADDLSLYYVYHYDNYHFPIKVEDLVNNGYVARSYGADHRLKEEKCVASFEYTTHYDQNERCHYTVLPNGKKLNYIFDEQTLVGIESIDREGKLTSLKTGEIFLDSEKVFAQKITLDTHSVIPSKEKPHFTYTYDALQRLIRVEQQEEQAITYVYDAYNRKIAQEKWVWDVEVLDWRVVETFYTLYAKEQAIAKLNQNFELIKVYPFKSETIEKFSTILEKFIVDHPSLSEEEKNDWVCVKRPYYEPLTNRWLVADPLDLFNFSETDQNGQVSDLQYYLTLPTVGNVQEYIKNTFFSCFDYLKEYAQSLSHELLTPKVYSEPFYQSLDELGQYVFGKCYHLMGFHLEDSEVGIYGEGEISEKVRVTFINGLLTRKRQMIENLKVLSAVHGDIPVHYVFRATRGWVWDATDAVMVKMGYTFGYRSKYAHMLADVWREMIQEMGGVDGGGVIIHYAHSLGGTDTDRARTLLTPEEQQMIRVTTIGSATFVRNEGFQSVVNHVSINDGVRFFEPLGHLRHFLAKESNVNFHGLFSSIRFPLIDHELICTTYSELVNTFGQEFAKEFLKELNLN